MLYWFYLLLICVGIIIPSDGQHGLFSIKSLAYILTFSSLGVYVYLQGKIQIRQVKIGMWFSFALFFLMIWFWVGIWQEQGLYSSQIDQLKLFILTVSIPLITLFMIQENILNAPQFFKTVILANTFYITLKVVCVVLHLLHWIDIWQVIGVIGIRFMRMPIIGHFERVQTSSDVVTPFLVFFVLESGTLGCVLSKKFKIFYLLIAFVSTLLSFSRYLIFVYICSVLLFMMHQNLLRIFKVSLGICLLLLTLYFSIGNENIETMFKRRLTSSENYYSDFVREQQVDALWKESQNNPYFGKGLGSYAPDYIRDPLLPHNYEVQWAAFLMQFGFIGIGGLFVLLVLITYRFYLPPFSLQKLSFIGIFLLWLLSGFTNPFLISLASGIMYALFYVSGYSLQINIPQQIQKL